MNITDRFGNPLKEGDTVAWLLPGGVQLLAKVTEVTPPDLLQTVDGTPSAGSFALNMQFPINKNAIDPAGNYAVSDMIKTSDPRDSRISNLVKH